jgi:hypothetical protein
MVTLTHVGLGPFRMSAATVPTPIYLIFISRLGFLAAQNLHIDYGCCSFASHELGDYTSVDPLAKK